MICVRLTFADPDGLHRAAGVLRQHFPRAGRRFWTPMKGALPEGLCIDAATLCHYARGEADRVEHCLVISGPMETLREALAQAPRWYAGTGAYTQPPHSPERPQRCRRSDRRVGRVGEQPFWIINTDNPETCQPTAIMVY